MPDVKLEVKLEFGDDDYRLVVGDVESDVVPYGEAVEIPVGNKRYISLCDQKDDGEVFSLLSDWVVEGVFVAGVATEDVDFEGDGEGDDDDAADDAAGSDDDGVVTE